MYYRNETNSIACHENRNSTTQKEREIELLHAITNAVLAWPKENVKSFLYSLCDDISYWMSVHENIKWRL